MISKPITLQTWDKNNHLPAVKIIQGDILSRTLTVTLVSSPNQPVDLTGAEVRLYLQQPDGTKAQVTATILDAAAGQIQATLPPLPPGKVSGTVRIAWQNGGVLYVPPFDVAVARNYAYAAYTHIRYAMDASGLGMTDKASLWESSGRNLVEGTNQGVRNWEWTNQANANISYSEIAEDGVRGCRMSRNGEPLGSWNSVKYKESGILTKLEPSTNYVVSVDIKTDVSITNFVDVSIKEPNSNNPFTTRPVQLGTTKDGEWISFNAVLRTLDEFPPITNQIIYFGIKNGVNTISIKNLSISKKQANWSPAPEDYPSDYRQPYIGICQTNDPIAPTDPAAYVWAKNKGGNT